MSKDQLHDFASTPEKGLPEHKSKKTKEPDEDDRPKVAKVKNLKAALPKPGGR